MNKDIRKFLFEIRFPILLLVFIWVVKVVEFLTGHSFAPLGIYPHEALSLPHILTAPFVHGSWGHLASNSLPILVLTVIIVLFYKKVAYKVFFTVMIGTGLMVWLFARPSYHIGISGVIYGLISFIFWTGVFKKNSKSIVLSLVVLVLYAGSVESVFPNVEPNISWESHLFGVLVGIVVAFVFKGVIEEDEERYFKSDNAENEQSREYFLPRDIFEKTKLQRYYEYIEAEQRRQQEDSF